MEHFGDSADAGAAVSIFELDASVLRRGGYDQIGLDVLVITPGSSERSDFGPSAVQCALERVRRDGVVVLGSEDRRSASAVREAGLSHLTYGVNRNADVSLQTIGVDDGVLTGMIRHEMNSAMMESHLGQGVFSESLVAAAAVGVATNNPLVQIAESLSGLRELPGRCQAITTDDWNVAHASPKMLLDVAGSPQRAEFVLQAIGKQTRAGQAGVIPMNARVRTSAAKRSKIWCVLAVSDRDDDATLARYGRLLETMADHCVLTCEPGCKERFLSLSHGVLDGVQECATIRLVADQERAVSWAAHAANPHDTVVVLGGVDRGSAQTQRQDLQRLQDLMRGLQRDVSGVVAKPSPQPLKLYQPDS
jgi:UDP-N-acetylmuramoyl-L-alanyl-D-glutamate--2,6-diaminopimelate ligase